ncbi:hypothetical protein CYMTET_27649 [Cymbomonas tetramitiformis]|uniref:Aspartyl/asparaginy/proline hydroxylase domain-containing protein n=1 Tax=Cymbomonas tetramitiformis TaxID=36881 RepID=A0AAE0KWR3_9CHLO|nr:hypothetical protein CYMTET_27649 [Cymbomonas tetramitiformis]
MSVALNCQVQEACYWTSPLQHPDHFYPCITSAPWHEPSEFPWAQMLEAQYPAIKRELLQVLGANLAAVESQGREEDGWADVGSSSENSNDALLLAGKDARWTEFVLLGEGDNGTGQASLNRTRCPITAAAVASIPAVTHLAEVGVGEALFSSLSPGTHLQAHCGGSNTRLTCHLPLLVPEGCRLRVGAETRAWQPGKCLFFDDSYEHEVWHDGAPESGARVVLLMRFWHPDLNPESWDDTVQEMEKLIAQHEYTQYPPLHFSLGED